MVISRRHDQSHSVYPGVRGPHWTFLGWIRKSTMTGQKSIYCFSKYSPIASIHFIIQINKLATSGKCFLCTLQLPLLVLKIVDRVNSSWFLKTGRSCVVPGRDSKFFPFKTSFVCFAVWELTLSWCKMTHARVFWSYGVQHRFFPCLQRRRTTISKFFIEITRPRCNCTNSRIAWCFIAKSGLKASDTLLRRQTKLKITIVVNYTTKIFMS